MKKRRSPGRPREFEPEVALEAAQATFRRYGFSGTSLTDLTEATGLNRPSLYATFGNKQALFEAAVDQYWDRVTAQCGAELARTGILAVDLKGFLSTFIDVFADDGPGGCVVACGLPADAHRYPEMKTKLAQLLETVDTSLARRFASAQRKGQLRAEVDAEILGALVVNTMFAMSLRSRAGTPRAALERQAAGLVGLILGAGGDPPGEPPSP